MCNGAATARSASDHSRWGNTPVRLRFSTPHWESKTTLEHAKMWTPRQLSNGNVTTPAVLALPARSLELPLHPQRRWGGRTERICDVLSTAHRKDQGQEHLQHRAEVEVLRLALDTSNRTLEAFGRSQADEGVAWPPHQRWGSLQVLLVKVRRCPVDADPLTCLSLTAEATAAESLHKSVQLL